MLDNIADLLLTVGMLAGVFHFPTTFALQYMVPGTAIGVLFGDLMFFGMALALARRTGRHDVTAMPLGLDTPSTIAMVLFVLGPSFLHARQQLGYDESQAAVYTWHIGICSIFLSGIFKVACAFVSGLGPPTGAARRPAWVTDRHRPGPDQFPAAARRSALSGRGLGGLGDYSHDARGPRAAAVSRSGCAGGLAGGRDAFIT